MLLASYWSIFILERYFSPSEIDGGNYLSSTIASVASLTSDCLTVFPPARNAVYYSEAFSRLIDMMSIPLKKAHIPGLGSNLKTGNFLRYLPTVVCLLVYLPGLLAGRPNRYGPPDMGVVIQPLDGSLRVGGGGCEMRVLG